jgi:hypothetical protein
MMWIAAYLYAAGAVITLTMLLEEARRPVLWRYVVLVAAWPALPAFILAWAGYEAVRDVARRAGAV